MGEWLRREIEADGYVAVLDRHDELVEVAVADEHEPRSRRSPRSRAGARG